MRSYSEAPDGVRISVTYDMVNTEMADMGGGVLLPLAFTATVMVEGDHTVQMDIAVEHGAPVCNALRIMRAEGRPSLTGHEMRRLPLAQWVTYACSIAGFANQGDVKTTDAEWRSAGYREAIEQVVRKSKRRNKVTPELLQEVARIYRENLDARPVEAVQQAFGPMGHSTAARYVKLARDEGLLPKTTQGKASN